MVTGDPSDIVDPRMCPVLKAVAYFAAVTHRKKGLHRLCDVTGGLGNALRGAEGLNGRGVCVHTVTPGRRISTASRLQSAHVKIVCLGCTAPAPIPWTLFPPGARPVPVIPCTEIPLCCERQESGLQTSVC